MFSNLSVGSIVYVLDTKDNYKLSTGQITSITQPRTKLATFNPYVQNAEYVVDIIATINGEKREFKQVPSNLSIANFGSDVFTLADSREAMLTHVDNVYRTKKAICDNIDKTKKELEECSKIRMELSPSFAAETQRDAVISNLENKVDNLTERLNALLSAINGKPKTEE